MNSMRIVTVTILAVALSATGVQAHPYGASHGYVAKVSHPGTNPTNIVVTTNVDGMYYAATIAALNFPFLHNGNHSVGTTSPCGNTNCINGANARPQQIVSTYPLQSNQNQEFLANGYFGGCAMANGARICSGTTSTGGVYKRWYQDGTICDPWYNCGYVLTGAVLAAMSTGTNAEFQMQRNGISGGGFMWQGWLRISGGSWQVKEFQRSGHRPQMWYGRASVGAENLNLSFVELALNMAQADWRNLSVHHYGDPSTSPPGTVNYTGTSAWTFDHPHVPCYLTQVTLTRLEGKGQC
jgi:hypothetical protein